MELEDSTVITRLHLGSGPAFLKALSDVSHGATIAEARVRIKCEPEAEGHHGPDPYRDFMLRVACAVTDPATQQREILAYYTPVNAAADLPSAAHPSALANARLGHELRTPLTAIIGFADCLGDPAIIAADDPKRGDYARIIGTSARHMLDVVNGMAGIAHPQPSAEIISSASDAIDLAELIDESVSIMRLNVEAQRASLHWIVEADVPVLIGSRHAFRQILINLISNALKFAPEGSVLVRASMRFFFVLSANPILPMGAREIFVSELRSLHDAHEKLRRPNYADKIVPDLERDLDTASLILEEIIDKAPGMLNFTSGKG